MALQSSGRISHGDIKGEFGGTTNVGLSNYYGAAAGIPTSGRIKESDFYGKSSGPVIPPSYAQSNFKTRSNTDNTTNGYHRFVQYYPKASGANGSEIADNIFDPGPSSPDGKTLQITRFATYYERVVGDKRTDLYMQIQYKAIRGRDGVFTGPLPTTVDKRFECITINDVQVIKSSGGEVYTGYYYPQRTLALFFDRSSKQGVTGNSTTPEHYIRWYAGDFDWDGDNGGAGDASMPYPNESPEHRVWKHAGQLKWHG